MNQNFIDNLLREVQADEISESEKVQSLWSGYGEIVRLGLKGSTVPTVIVKHIKFPKMSLHPRGWNTDISHQRKCHSYKVETAWYNQYSQECDEGCRVPKCILIDSNEGEVFIALEDLNSAGFPIRKQSVNLKEVKYCLTWLAHFHGKFMGRLPEDLWEVGTYWHLDTRPDELEVLDDLKLKKDAGKINQILNESHFKTIVHGDAKLANFCFSDKSNLVAAVDFQYVGGGCGMKDVAYFIGSCLHENECEQLESELLNFYFLQLRKVMLAEDQDFDFKNLELQWRALFPVAWTDFHRFIKGWSPGHWKINDYSEKMTKQVLENL